MPVSPTIPSRSNGQTIEQTWFNILKQALDDHEDRIATIEGEIFQIPMSMSGAYSDLVLPAETKLIVVPNFEITLIDVEVVALKAGTLGTLEVDIKHNESGSFVSALSTKPSVEYTAGDLGKSTNGVVDASKDVVSAGKIIRVDVTSVQTKGIGFLVLLTAQRS